MRSHRLALSMLAALAAGCGGGGGRTTPLAPTPATPAPTPPPVLVARDGLTEQVVAADVTPPSPPVGVTVALRAPGYLVREQRWSGPPIFLWPGTDLAYVDELVYDWEFQDGTRRLVRWQSGFTFTLDGDLAEDPGVVAKAQEVAAEMSRVTGLNITVGPGGPCLVVVDPAVADDDAVAEARVRFMGPNIVGGTVRFANRREIAGGSRSDYRNTLLHEMGHILGLGHSPNTRDVMTPGAGPGTRVAVYQEGEALSLHMMYRHRTAGNIFPDRDPALGAAAALEPREVVIID